MHKLYIIRHGKAEDPNFSKRDFERNLVDKGRQEIIRITRDMAVDIEIDASTLAISSSANRAIQTAELACEILAYPIDQVKQDIQIYEAHHLDILKVINRIPDNIKTVFLFGHNPGLSDLTHYLTNQYAELKTSNIAYLEFPDNISFSQLSGQMATLKRVFD